MKGMNQNLRRSTLALVGCLAVVSVTILAVGLSSGPKQGGLTIDPTGCNCHATTANPGTVITFTGVPDTYVAGATYDLNISSTTDVVLDPVPQNHGGFHLQASDGTFAARGATLAAWVGTGTSTPKGSWIEHKTAGETSNAPVGGVQKWEVSWTAPNSGDVTFKVWVNRVNGDAQANAADHWNTKTVTSKGPSGGGNGGGSPGFDVGLLVAAVGLATAIVLRRRK